MEKSLHEGHLFVRNDCENLWENLVELSLDHLKGKKHFADSLDEKGENDDVNPINL